MTDMTPGSAEWARRVSPSKAAAILGISPWDSQRAIYHKMRGEVPWDDENEVMERGNLLEAGVLAWWRKHHDDTYTGWCEQVTLTVGNWLVATPDAMCEVDGELIIVEAKTTSSLDDWGDPGTDVIPAYYLTQAYLAGRVCWLNDLPVQRIHFPVLGPRLRFAEWIVAYDDTLGADLERRMKVWFDSLAADEPPDLDDTVATWDAVRKIHRDIDAGTEVELTRDEAHELVELQADIRAIEPALRYAKSTVVERMGRAQYATHNGVRIARRQADGPDRTKFVVVAKPPDLTTPMEEAS